MSDKIEFENTRHKFFYLRKCIENWKQKDYTKWSKSVQDLPNKTYVRIVDNKHEVYNGVMCKYSKSKFKLTNPYSEAEDKDLKMLRYSSLVPNPFELEEKTNEEMKSESENSDDEIYNEEQQDDVEFGNKLNEFVGVYVSKKNMDKKNNFKKKKF